MGIVSLSLLAAKLKYRIFGVLNIMKPAYIFRSGNSDDIDQIKKLTLYSYMQFRKVISDENARVWEESLGNEITYKELFLIARCFVSE